MVLAVFYVFSLLDVSSAVVVNICRGVWLAAHTAYAFVYRQLYINIQRIEDPALRETETGKLSKFLRKVLIKMALILTLHFVTGKPQPLLFGGIVTTVLQAPLRRDFKNSLIYKYLIAGGSSSGGSDKDDKPEKVSSPQACLSGGAGAARPSHHSRSQHNYGKAGAAQRGRGRGAVLTARGSMPEGRLRGNWASVRRLTKPRAMSDSHLSAQRGMVAIR